MNRIILIFLLLSILGHFNSSAQAIPALSFDLKKPEKFENKKLGSEKTGEKKFTLPRRFVQNTVTKFNWHFNANEKLNEVIERAKLQHKDDYTQLLSFYNYSLDATSNQKAELDSVIYKANAGILLHDLRNSWIDNLYLLMGQAYYYRKEFDTAYLTFQYINYAFSPKEKDGYDKPIGSNANEGSNAFSISTKEKNYFGKSLWTKPPSRNESFIWQIRTYLAQEAYAEAAGLIETLKNDPSFPARLEVSLNEMRALWFYQQNIYDSAANYLEKAIPNAASREEQARWEYLIAQLYERSGNNQAAETFYEKAVKHSLNPVLEVYARLNAIRQNKGDEKALAANIEALRKMARKDRFTNYRDIIYYAQAQMELERNDTSAAKALLLASSRAMVQNSGDPLQKSKSFLMLADLSFSQGLYTDAKRYYDSVTNTEIVLDRARFDSRKSALKEIAAHAAVIERQDSLQRIAGMPDADREKFIRKLVKQLRKQSGLKEEELTGGIAAINPENALPNDLFVTDTKGEWYFYNPSLKQKGLTEFRSKWGNRPNADNWRRLAAVKQATRREGNDAAAIDKTTVPDQTVELSYEGLLKNVPLTPARLKASNDSIEKSELGLGNGLMNGLEDYPAAVRTFTDFLARFPESDKKPEVLFNLIYCYRKMGDEANAARMLAELQARYAGTDFEKRASQPGKGKGTDSLQLEMTKQYESIYNLFIEGRFEEAVAAKKSADSLFSSNYWTPQLLYIESIYYIRQRQDDTAKKVLNDIIRLYPSTPMAEKAKTMVNVLGRRKEIEKHLTELIIERPGEDSTVQAPVNAIAGQKDTLNAAIHKPADNQAGKPPKPVVPDQATKDSLASRPTAPFVPAYKLHADAPHFVVVVLDKVDPVFVTEAKNAFNRYNKQTYYNKTIDLATDELSDSIKLVVMSPFTNAAEALDYMEKTKKIAASSIVPWLPPAKFSFIIISQENLEQMKQAHNLAEYRKFLLQSFPGKFE